MLIMNVSFAYSNMSPCKKFASKAPMTEACEIGSQQEEDSNTSGAIYGDTMGFIKKGTFLKWGEFFQMFKKKKIPIEAEYEDELKVLKNIRKLGLHRVATHTTVFPCVDAILWII